MQQVSPYREFLSRRRKFELLHRVEVRGFPVHSRAGGRPEDPVPDLTAFSQHPSPQENVGTRFCEKLMCRLVAPAYCELYVAILQFDRAIKS